MLNTPRCVLALMLLSSLTPESLAKAFAPILASDDIPRTSFACHGLPTGYYADGETKCQVYHLCTPQQHFVYKCPNSTRFHQRMQICAHWYQVDCHRILNEALGFNHKLLRNSPPDELQKLTGEGDVGKPKTEEDLQTAYSRRPQFTLRGRSTEAGVTEQELGPTNASFRSTIETPNWETATNWHTQPMTPPSLPPPGGTAAPPPTQWPSTRRPREPAPTLAPPSLHLLPPEAPPTVELRLEDPRAALYIPEEGPPPPRSLTLVSVPLSKHSSFKAKAFAGKELVKACSRCHPAFLRDKTLCSPCLIIN